MTIGRLGGFYDYCNGAESSLVAGVQAPLPRIHAKAPTGFTADPMSMGASEDPLAKAGLRARNRQGPEETAFPIGKLNPFKKKKKPVEDDENEPGDEGETEPTPKGKEKEAAAEESEPETEEPHEHHHEAAAGTCGGEGGGPTSPTIVIPTDGSLLARLGLAPAPPYGYGPYPYGYGGGYGYGGYGYGMPPMPPAYPPYSPFGMFNTGFVAGAKAANEHVKSALLSKQIVGGDKTGFIDAESQGFIEVPLAGILGAKGAQWAEFFPQA
mmetsp:Transcript_54096/g.128830  ORF Transcript_54096/g.128830 Transcript_54096/m.128830 type:complete len:268 (+) Transcript_54096:96-899(+)